MKFKLLQEVIGKIKSNLKCPDCTEPPKIEDLEVIEILENRVKMSVPCASCNKTVHLVVEMIAGKRKGIHKITSKSGFSFKPQKSKKIESDDVKKISKELSDFDGINIDDLFN